MTYSNLVQTYPNFVADQVLTEDQLNKMRDFLDAQNRATRVKLIGIGIICGLNARIEKTATETSLVISEGYGVTSEGWLISIPEKKYIHVQDYTDPDFENGSNFDVPNYLPWRDGIPKEADNIQIPIQNLLEKEDPINGSDSIQTNTQNIFEDKALVLYLEKNTSELKSCYTTDCNNKGQSIGLNVKALLIDKTLMDLPDSRCSLHKDFPKTLTFTPRFSTGLSITHDKKVCEVNQTEEINDSYQNIYSYLNNELKPKIQTVFSHARYFNLLDVDADLIQLFEKLDEIDPAPNPNQYHFDFIKDVVDAYNELVLHLCKIIKPCCPKQNFPRHLMVRFFDADLKDDEQCRHPFYPSPVRNVMDNDMQKARNLYHRILQFGRRFSIPGSAIETIRITPGASDAQLLGERAIPYYYKKEIAPFWHPDACCDRPLTGYHLAKDIKMADKFLAFEEYPLHYFLNRETFLRIEGHLLLPQKAVLEKIDQMRDELNLDFQILALPLEVTNKTVFFREDEKLTAIDSEWKKLFEDVEKGITDKQYVTLINNLKSEYTVIIGNYGEWCKQEIAKKATCNTTSVQTDYNILRAEVLCLLRKCRAAFKELPDIEFEIREEDELIAACLNYEALGVGNQFGPSNGNERGEVILREKRVDVSVEPFKYVDRDDVFFYLETEGNSRLNLRGITLRFDLDKNKIGFTANEVTFLCNEVQENFTNLTVNGIELLELQIDQYFTQQEIGNNIFLKVEELEKGMKGIITGEEINEVLIGGTNMTLGEFCFSGLNENRFEQKRVPDFTLESRRDKILRLSSIIEKTTPKDIRCFSIELFQSLFKDLVRTAVELKLWYACIFKSVGGRFLPYKYYPEWNDFEDCLDHLHGSCLIDRMVPLAYIWRAMLHPMSFGDFVKKYPGVVHRAGVSQGGTSILVYQNESKPEVVADFCLEHFVDDCCSCSVEMADLKLPPVAHVDYHIVDLATYKPGFPISIPVLENDVNLDDDKILKIVSIGQDGNKVSDKGADLDTDLGKEKTILYANKTPSEGIDHFIYQIENNQGLTDVGHVYVGFFNEFKKTSASGLISGEVLNASTEALIDGFNFEVLDERGNLITSGLGRKGKYQISLNEGIYNLRFSHALYAQKGLPDVQVEAGITKELQTVFLTRILIPVERRNLASVNLARLGERLGSNDLFNNASRFVKEEAGNENITMAAATKAYNKNTAAILKTIKTAEGGQRKDLISLLATVNHTFMDKVVVENPDRPNKKAIAAMERVELSMNEEGISTVNLLKNWKSNELKTIVEGRATTINSIRNTFRKNS